MIHQCVHLVKLRSCQAIYKGRQTPVQLWYAGILTTINDTKYVQSQKEWVS